MLELSYSQLGNSPTLSDYQVGGHVATTGKALAFPYLPIPEKTWNLGRCRGEVDFSSRLSGSLLRLKTVIPTTSNVKPTAAPHEGQLDKSQG